MILINVIVFKSHIWSNKNNPIKWFYLVFKTSESGYQVVNLKTQVDNLQPLV